MNFYDILFAKKLSGSGGGVTPTGTLNITENGSYDVTQYAEVDVDIPQPSGTIDITENGIINIADYAQANVNVSSDPPTYRTVLYTDGTFIINESSRDQEQNEAEHGAATNVYAPFDPNGATNIDRYEFTGSTQRPWYDERVSVRTIKIGSDIKPTITAHWFEGFRSCTSADLIGLDTSSVTDMSSMFSDCGVLTNLDLSGFNTKSVTNMSNMFYECRLLTSIDISGFNTSNVTNMRSMFEHCEALTSLDVSSFDTSNVTNMSSMFYTCEALTSLDVSDFYTSKVTNMNLMFYGCQALTSLDVSSFDTSNVTNMSSMFSRCDNMVTIYASQNFVVSQVTQSSDMFYLMDGKLRGGAGTTWSSFNPKDKTYARIDGGTSNPGYFTAK